MSRKRAKQHKIQEKKTISKKPTRRIKLNKKTTTALILISLFCLVLFMNSYFNFTSDMAYNSEGTTLGTRFYLSGPDPYYNMRLCEETLKNGYYPSITGDPLLNYPMLVSGGARPPLFNMLAVTSAKTLSNFMPEMDALGWSMLFLPAIYGALLVFPVYGLGKELFSRKVGLISALFLGLIPIHIGSGHGSAFALFDHDSFLLLLSTSIFLLTIKSLKEDNIKKSLLYAGMAGVFVGAMEMTWVAAEFIFAVLLLGMLITILMDLFTNRANKTAKNALTFSMLFGVAFIVQLPYSIVTNHLVDFSLYAIVASVLVLGLYYIIKKLNVPWVISIPSLFGTFFSGIIFIYLVMKNIITIPNLISEPIYSIGKILFGSGIYGNKVALTIAEASTFDFSKVAMSFGPILFPLACFGIFVFIWKMHKEKYRPEYLFFLMMFIVDLWLLSTAGRFINELVPIFSILAASVLVLFITKLNFKQLLKNIHQIRGIRGIRKTVKITQLFSILFVISLLFTSAFVALDSAVPSNYKHEIFDEAHRPAFGNSVYKELYWSEAFHWLSQQDTELAPGDRPGFISWWDYGFYEVAIGKHPTVADNYQSGVEVAANFQTATSEEAAVSVLIIRLMHSVCIWKAGTVAMPDYIKDSLLRHLPQYNETITEENNTRVIVHTPAKDIIDIITHTKENAPSYDKLITPEYGNDQLRISENNAVYHDVVAILTKELTDDEITNLYKEMQEITGNSIRYYGVEGYDARDILAVFTFLADKGVHRWITPEDDYFKTTYVDRFGNEHSLEDIEAYSIEQRTELAPFNPRTTRKIGYFETMVYKAYYGWHDNLDFPEYSVPTFALRHFIPVYISELPYPGTRVPAVVIAKYYEGAKIEGKVTVGGHIPYNGAELIVFDEQFDIPHDSNIVGVDGVVKVIAPAGAIKLKLMLSNNELAVTTFDTLEHPAITEDEAMRFGEYNRTVSFDVSFANVSGMINGSSESSEMELELKITSMEYSGIEKTQTINDLSYSFKELVPSTYRFIVTNTTGTEMYNATRFLMPNNNTYDFTVSYPTYPGNISDDGGTV